MKNKMFDIAKQKDDGKFAKMGMRDFIATWFNMDYYSPCLLEIVDTYLECIDNISFDDYIYGLYAGGKPLILTRQILETKYKDLLYVSDDLEIIADLFMYLYDKEFYIDKQSDCLWSTNYHDFNRKKLNFIGIAMEYERLCTLHSNEILSWSDIDTLIECLIEYGYDIEKDYEIRTNDIYETASNIEERLEEVFYL